MRFPILVALLALLPVLSQSQPIDSLDLKIGQMIMIGIGDRTSLNSDDALVQELAQGKVGGVVLFEKNISSTNSKAALQSLITNLKKHSLLPLFVSIDEEGGRVHRLKSKYGFFDIPSAADLGRINNLDTTLAHHRRLAALLSELGINLNYAPVVDMAVNPNNTVIVKNERSFGNDGDIVTRHAEQVIKAHHEYGILTVLKHFPGHGSSTTDSHYGIVDVTKTWQLRELIPYDQLIRTRHYDGLMTAHIINQRWDASRLPATLSKSVITTLLRTILDYPGPVFSDDMQMQAISDHYGFENAIALAINAGVDVLMFANTLPSQDKHVSASQVHGTIKKLLKENKINESRINESYRRIQEMKNGFQGQ